jgi:hypothetical protein
VTRVRSLDDDAGRRQSSAGTVILSPVPIKPKPLGGPGDQDKTAFLPASKLFERGRAIAAFRQTRQPPRPAPSTSPSARASAAPPGNVSALQQLREASGARKLTLVVLPMLIGLLVFKPVFKKPRAGRDAAAALGPAGQGQEVGPHSRDVVSLQTGGPAASSPPPALGPSADVGAASEREASEARGRAPSAIGLPRGTDLEAAAIAALAAGDYERALTIYRELSRRHLENVAYHAAVEILQRRRGEIQP